MTTKTTRKRLKSLHPPVEIRQDTKARRAWVDAKVAEINATPGMEAKSVGTGSYQSVTVWQVTEVAARTRHRGTCQVCANSQVVNERGVLVLHGYTRPGDGYITGRCPGMDLRPAEHDVTVTKSWIVSCENLAKQMHALLVEDGCEYQEQGNYMVFPNWARNLRYSDAERHPEAEAAKARMMHTRDHTRSANVRHARMLTEMVLPRLGQPLTEEVV